MRYRRAFATGATWFFTVNLADRQQDLLTRHITLLRELMHEVKAHHPFEICHGDFAGASARHLDTAAR